MDDRILLPKGLQEKAMELAHRGTLSGQSGLESRLWYHFFFHNMFQKTQKFLQNCEPCLIFNKKKTKEPITPHYVPTKCWEKVSVDLFGPFKKAYGGGAGSELKVSRSKVGQVHKSRISPACLGDMFTEIPASSFQTMGLPSMVKRWRNLQ